VAHVKKGDTVLVLAGKDKGVRGTVLSVDVETNRVLVEGVNRVKRHTKVTQGTRGATVGGILTVEAPIHISNVKVTKEDKSSKKAKKAAEVVDEVETTEDSSEVVAKPKKTAKKAPAKKAETETDKPKKVAKKAVKKTTKKAEEK
jgi:large subunit ribosomal protein L24